MLSCFVSRVVCDQERTRDMVNGAQSCFHFSLSFILSSPPSARSRSINIPCLSFILVVEPIGEAWDQIPQAWVKRLADSLPQCLQDCVQSEGELVETRSCTIHLMMR